MKKLLPILLALLSFSCVDPELFPQEPKKDIILIKTPVKVLIIDDVYTKKSVDIEKNDSTTEYIRKCNYHILRIKNLTKDESYTKLIAEELDEDIYHDMYIIPESTSKSSLSDNNINFQGNLSVDDYLQVIIETRLYDSDEYELREINVAYKGKNEIKVSLKETAVTTRQLLDDKEYTTIFIPYFKQGEFKKMFDIAWRELPKDHIKALKIVVGDKLTDGQSNFIFQWFIDKYGMAGSNQNVDDRLKSSILGDHLTDSVTLSEFEGDPVTVKEPEPEFVADPVYVVTPEPAKPTSPPVVSPDKKVPATPNLLLKNSSKQKIVVKSFTRADVITRSNLAVSNKDKTIKESVNTSIKTSKTENKIIEALENGNVEFFKPYGNKLSVKDIRFIASIPNLRVLDLGGSETKKIPSGAFRNKQKLVKVVLPKTTKIIGNAAFEHCIKLEVVENLNNNPLIVQIGFRAFNDCLKLKQKLTLTESLTYLGYAAFQRCKNLEGSLIIPSSLKKVYHYAFYESGFTGKLILNSGITSVEEGAFANTAFKGLLIIPSSVKEIGPIAFQNTNFFGELFIPNTVSSVDIRAFNNTRHSSVTIEGSNTKFNYFDDDKNANWIFYSPRCKVFNLGKEKSNQTFSGENLKYFFRRYYVAEVNTMVIKNINIYGKLDVIPDLTGPFVEGYFQNFIGTFNYYNDLNLKSGSGDPNTERSYMGRFHDPHIYMRDNSKIIGKSLGEFDDNNPDRSIQLYVSNSVGIDPGALNYDISSLIVTPKTRTLPTNFLSNGSGFRLETALIVYNTVEMNVNDNMFNDLNYGGYNVLAHPGDPSIKIARHRKFRFLQVIEPVTSTKMSASGKYTNVDLYNNSNYEFIAFPSKLGISTLKGITDYAFENDPNLMQIIGLENVESIGSFIFKNSPNIDYMSLHKVKSIGKRAFAKSNLVHIDLSESPLTSLSDYAFADCPSLHAIDMTNFQTKTFPEYCFANDHQLEFLILGESEEKPVKSQLSLVKHRAFSNCKTLTVLFPNTLRTIEHYSFEHCSGLQINLGSGLYDIGDWSFWDCPYLGYINIPKTVRYIGKGAFKTRSPFKTLMVQFNWDPYKDEIIPYRQDVWPYGELAIMFPDDKIHWSYHYYQKNYGKKYKLLEEADKVEISNWDKQFKDHLDWDINLVGFGSGGNDSPDYLAATGQIRGLDLKSSITDATKKIYTKFYDVYYVIFTTISEFENFNYRSYYAAVLAEFYNRNRSSNPWNDHTAFDNKLRKFIFEELDFNHVEWEELKLPSDIGERLFNVVSQINVSNREVLKSNTLNSHPTDTLYKPITAPDYTRKLRGNDIWLGIDVPIDAPYPKVLSVSTLKPGDLSTTNYDLDYKYDISDFVIDAYNDLDWFSNIAYIPFRYRVNYEQLFEGALYYNPNLPSFAVYESKKLNKQNGSGGDPDGDGDSDSDDIDDHEYNPKDYDSDDDDDDEDEDDDDDDDWYDDEDDDDEYDDYIPDEAPPEADEPKDDDWFDFRDIPDKDGTEPKTPEPTFLGPIEWHYGPEYNPNPTEIKIRWTKYTPKLKLPDEPEEPGQPTGFDEWLKVQNPTKFVKKPTIVMWRRPDLPIDTINVLAPSAPTAVPVRTPTPVPTGEPVLVPVTVSNPPEPVRNPNDPNGFTLLTPPGYDPETPTLDWVSRVTRDGNIERIHVLNIPQPDGTAVRIIDDGTSSDPISVPIRKPKPNPDRNDTIPENNKDKEPEPKEPEPKEPEPRAPDEPGTIVHFRLSPGEIINIISSVQLGTIGLSATTVIAIKVGSKLVNVAYKAVLKAMADGGSVSFSGSIANPTSSIAGASFGNATVKIGGNGLSNVGIGGGSAANGSVSSNLSGLSSVMSGPSVADGSSVATPSFIVSETSSQASLSSVSTGSSASSTNSIIVGGTGGANMVTGTTGTGVSVVTTTGITTATEGPFAGATALTTTSVDYALNLPSASLLPNGTWAISATPAAAEATQSFASQLWIFVNSIQFAMQVAAAALVFAIAIIINLIIAFCITYLSSVSYLNASYVNLSTSSVYEPYKTEDTNPILNRDRERKRTMSSKEFTNVLNSIQSKEDGAIHFYADPPSKFPCSDPINYNSSMD